MDCIAVAPDRRPPRLLLYPYPKEKGGNFTALVLIWIEVWLRWPFQRETRQAEQADPQHIIRLDGSGVVVGFSSVHVPPGEPRLPTDAE
jgi:hypothetical protein